MNVSINKAKNVLTIEIPLMEPQASKSGKSILVASTQGNIKTSTMFNGKPLTVSVNAYVPVGGAVMAAGAGAGAGAGVERFQAAA